MMSTQSPAKVLIAGGKPGGGIASFAEALRLGFSDLGLPVEIAPPFEVLRRVRDLRDPAILKILSLVACYGAPIARRAICVAHGFPCVANQGWTKFIAILASVQLGSWSRGAQVVEVSEYSALHMQQIFGIRIDAVIRNPIHPIFLESPAADEPREAITYVGRLHRSKNVDKLLPAMRDVLDENPGMRAWIIGDGELRLQLESIIAGDPRVEFLGSLPPIQVRDRLRRTRTFVSACATEAFGITYLEALSQGCCVAMPSAGGGIEIAPELIGSRIQLFRPAIKREEVASAIRRSIKSFARPSPVGKYSPKGVARAYLIVNDRFDAKGIFQAGTCDERRGEDLCGGGRI